MVSEDVFRQIDGSTATIPITAELARFYYIVEILHIVLEILLILFLFFTAGGESSYVCYD